MLNQTFNNGAMAHRRMSSPPPVLVVKGAGEIISTPRIVPHQNQANDLREREENAISNMINEFRTLAILATTPVEDGATKEVAASQAFELEVHSSALIRASEELLQLTRELKELWLFGPLRGIKEGEGEGTIDEDSVKVGNMIGALLKKTSE